MFSFGKIKLYFLLVTSFVATLVLTYFGGKKVQSVESEKEKLEDYVDTRKQMDEVSSPTDPDDARKWLRKHGGK